MTTVPGVISGPVIRSPALSDPLVTAVTHSVVPEIEPAMTALGVEPTLVCVRFCPQLQPGTVDPCPEWRNNLFGVPVFQSTDLNTGRDAIGG
jgi:hypothetical protein